MRITQDDVSPLLARCLAVETMRAQLLGKAGLVLVQMATRSFTTPSLRPRPWPPRKTPGKHPLLLKTGMLRRSLRLIRSSAQSATVGSDRDYAAIHQFGGVIRPVRKKALSWPGAKHPVRAVKIPARPFFPITPEGGMTAEAEKNVLTALETAVRAGLKK